MRLFSDFTLSVMVFFFQAEDGIRDRDVTGVQTCALPIYEVLGLKDMNLHATVIVALGYRAESDKGQEQKKVRLPIEEMVVMIKK